DDDDEDDEESRRRPRKKKKKRRRSSGGMAMGGVPVLLIVLLAGGVVCLALIVVAVFVPAMALLVALVGSAISLVGLIWLVIIAAQEGIGHAIGCFCCFPYAIFYFATHFDETKYAFLIYIVGMIVSGIGRGLSGFGGDDDFMPQRPGRFVPPPRG